MRWPLALIKARQVRGLSQSDAGRAMGISQVSYGNRERGVTEIGEEWLAQFLDKIDMKRAEFDAIVQRVPVQSVTPSEDIPLYPNLAAAGQRAFCPEDEGDEWTATVDRGSVTKHPRAFAVKSDGDSMEPRIMSGDTVVCEPIDDEHGIGALTDGKMVVVWGGATETMDFQRDGDRRAKPMIVPTGGMIGLWAWVNNGAELRKANQRYQSIRIPAQHDGTLRIAVVVEMRRANP